MQYSPFKAFSHQSKLYTKRIKDEIFYHLKTFLLQLSSWLSLFSIILYIYGYNVQLGDDRHEIDRVCVSCIIITRLYTPPYSTWKMIIISKVYYIFSIVLRSLYYYIIYKKSWYFSTSSSSSIFACCNNSLVYMYTFDTFYMYIMILFIAVSHATVGHHSFKRALLDITIVSGFIVSIPVFTPFYMRMAVRVAIWCYGIT